MVAADAVDHVSVFGDKQAVDVKPRVGSCQAGFVSGTDSDSSRCILFAKLPLPVVP
jgi:hypothetical protein